MEKRQYSAPNNPVWEKYAQGYPQAEGIKMYRILQNFFRFSNPLKWAEGLNQKRIQSMARMCKYTPLPIS